MRRMRAGLAGVRGGVRCAPLQRGAKTAPCCPCRTRLLPLRALLRPPGRRRSPRGGHSSGPARLPCQSKPAAPCCSAQARAHLEGAGALEVRKVREERLVGAALELRALELGNDLCAREAGRTGWGVGARARVHTQQAVRGRGSGTRPVPRSAAAAAVPAGSRRRRARPAACRAAPRSPWARRRRRRRRPSCPSWAWARRPGSPPAAPPSPRTPCRWLRCKPGRCGSTLRAREDHAASVATYACACDCSGAAGASRRQGRPRRAAQHRQQRQPGSSS